MATNVAILLGFIVGELLLILMLAWTYNQIKEAGVFRDSPAAQAVARLAFIILPVVLAVATLPGVASRIRASQAGIPDTGDDDALSTIVARAYLTMTVSPDLTPGTLVPDGIFLFTPTPPATGLPILPSPMPATPEVTAIASPDLATLTAPEAATPTPAQPTLAEPTVAEPTAARPTAARPTATPTRTRRPRPTATPEPTATRQPTDTQEPAQVLPSPSPQPANTEPASPSPAPATNPPDTPVPILPTGTLQLTLPTLAPTLPELPPPTSPAPVSPAVDTPIPQPTEEIQVTSTGTDLEVVRLKWIQGKSFGKSQTARPTPGGGAASPTRSVPKSKPSTGWAPTSTPGAPPGPTATPTTGPDLSQNGKIVFVCQVNANPDADQLCLIQPDGSGFRQLTDNTVSDFNFPALSPDGSQVIYTSNETGIYEIYEMNLDGSAEKLTGKLGFSAGDSLAPDISPDGQQIVYTLRTEDRQGVWLMGRDGTGPHQLFGPPQANAWDPTWSPDGTQVLFASDYSGAVQLFTINADGTNLTQVTQIDGLRGRGDWSPAGDWIATYRGDPWNREVVLIKPDGSGLRSITSGGNNLSPSFSPDGRWIVFTSYRDRYGNDNGCEIYVMRVDGSEITRLTDNTYCDWQPRWGP